MARQVEPEPQTAPARKVRIEVTAGPYAGDTYEVKRFPAVIGRGQESDIRLRDDVARPTISRRHLKLFWRGGHLAVEDLSTNGTQVDGRLLEPGSHVLVTSTSLIRMGPRTAIRVEVVPYTELVEEPPPQPAPFAEIPTGKVDVSALLPPKSEPVQLTGAVPMDVRMLTDFTVTVQGRTLPDALWTSRKVRSLFAFLVEQRGKATQVYQLREAIWPGALEVSRAALHTTVTRIRKGFKEALGVPFDPVDHDQARYRLNNNISLTSDVQRFETFCEEGQRAMQEVRLADAEVALEKALQVYQAPFLDGLDEDWVIKRRQQLATFQAWASVTLAQLYEQRGAYNEAEATYQRVLENDPCNDEAQQGLVRTLASAGNVAEALRVYQYCVQVLKKQMNATPSPALQALFRSLTGSEAATEA